MICKKQVNENNVKPYDPYGHNWKLMEEGYYSCTRCGLENSNGADGSIVLEDMTDAYGNDENYVVGYWNKTNVEYTTYIALVNPDVEIIDSQNMVTITELTDVCAYAFSKADIAKFAESKGLAEGEYEVCFVFVPYGADGSFDYAITFGSLADQVAA